MYITMYHSNSQSFKRMESAGTSNLFTYIQNDFGITEQYIHGISSLLSNSKTIRYGSCHSLARRLSGSIAIIESAIVLVIL